MYAAPPVLETTVFARIPENLRIRGRSNRNKTLYITEAESGSVLSVQLDVPGQAMFSHS